MKPLLINNTGLEVELPTEGFLPYKKFHAYRCPTCNRGTNTIVVYKIGKVMRKECVHCYNSFVTEVEIFTGWEWTEDWIPVDQYNTGEGIFTYIAKWITYTIPRVKRAFIRLRDRFRGTRKLPEEVKPVPTKEDIKAKIDRNLRYLELDPQDEP